MPRDTVTVPREPTEIMLEAARDWSIAKFHRGIGDDAAIGCWRAMYDAYLATPPPSDPEGGARGVQTSIADGQQCNEHRLNALSDRVREFLAGVHGFVEADRYAQQALWEEYVGRHKATWVSNLSGIGETVGYFGNMPVFVSLLTSVVNGTKLCFYEATSQVVDHRMVEDWLRKAAPKTAFWPDGRLNRTDAQNFHNIFRAPQELAVAETDANAPGNTGFLSGVSSAPNHQPHAVSQGWRTDLENAPRDGTRFLACATEPGWGATRIVRFAHPYDRLPLDDGRNMWPSAPTHWMSLPAPPSPYSVEER